MRGGGGGGELGCMTWVCVLGGHVWLGGAWRGEGACMAGVCMAEGACMAWGQVACMSGCVHGWRGVHGLGGHAWLGEGMYGWGRRVAGPTHALPPYGWQAGGTHPAGMLTC